MPLSLKLLTIKLERFSSANLFLELSLLSTQVSLDYEAKACKDKHSCFIVQSVNKEKKSFVALIPGVNVIKLFSFDTDNEA
jgi:hypothetical protein